MHCPGETARCLSIGLGTLRDLVLGPLRPKAKALGYSRLALWDSNFQWPMTFRKEPTQPGPGMHNPRYTEGCRFLRARTRGASPHKVSKS